MSNRELSQRDFASTLGLTTQQVRNLEDKGLPHRAEGRRKFYPVPAAVQWYVQFKIDEQHGRSGSESEYEKARTRSELARAQLAEMEVAKEQGRLIPQDVAEEWYGTRMLDVLRAGLTNMPGRWGAQVVGIESPREGESVLKRISNELLEHFSGDAADALEAEPDDEGDENAA